MNEFKTENKPFVLIARIHVKPGNVDQYLEIAAKVDAEVENSEPGMLFHNFDADPSDPLSFTWTEVYKNDAALITHINNPPVQGYVEQHAELGDGFEIEIYGELGEEAIEAVKALGVPFKHFVTTDVGYVRQSMTG
jgi:quinol monooxygenase YgiN